VIRIDPESRIPIYAQIVEQIKAQITVGQFTPGDQLPTLRQLATDLRVNFNTVARAYMELERKELISTQRGRGTFIADNFEEQALAEMRNEKMELVIGTVLEELYNLGYSHQEVEQTFRQKLKETYNE
jgi:GntR family transcriptional regulator